MSVGNGAAMPGEAQAIPIDPIFQKINEHEQKGELDAAEALLVGNFGANPTHPHAIHMSGILACRRGRIDEGRQRMERSLLLRPDVPLYLRNLCEVYRLLGRFDDGVAVGQRAIEHVPADVAALINLSLVHYDRGDYEAAIGCADRVVAINPDSPAAHFERAKALLALGRFEEGWEEYEWRFKLPGAGTLIPRNDKPQWDGRPLGNGSLLLVADQGFGDVAQFSRYIPWVTTRCQNVVVASGPEMAPVLRQFAGVRAVVTRWQDAGEFACYCPLSGLPRLHKTTLETIPADVPYLRADPAKVARWRAKLDALVPKGHRRIGIAWAGRPTHKNDATRSLQLADFAPIAALATTTLISLQKGDACSQVGRYYGAAPLVHIGPDLQDFDDTLAALAAIDQVICVDTSLGHIAGALGKPTWLLLAYATDWRWLQGREDSPWYPKHRLVRQSTPGAWSPVFDRVASEFNVPVGSSTA